MGLKPRNAVGQSYHARQQCIKKEGVIMNRLPSEWLILSVLFWVLFSSPAMAAEFHVTNADQLHAALSTARTNGEDDTIFLAAGTYGGNFDYSNPEPKQLTLKGEEGTAAEEV